MMNAHLDVLTRSLVLEGTLTTTTALHVGSRRSLDPIESDNPVMKDHEGRPLIPGSSLKGVLRSALETVLRGLGANSVCSPSDDHYCVDKDQWSQVDHVLEHACPVCRLFGAPYLASRIRVEDLQVSGDWDEAYYILRDGVAIDRDSRTAAHGKKFDFETIPAGVPFSLRITLTNPEDHEVGMLALALDLLSQGMIFLGGNTSRGLGRVSIEIQEVKECDAASLGNFFKGEGDLYRSVRWEELRKKGLKALEEKLKEWKTQEERHV